MALPASFKPKGLSPQVKIYDQNDVLKYTWQSPNIVGGSPTKDFQLYGYDLHMAYGSDFGNLSLYIHDVQKALVDLTDKKVPHKILNEYKIDFSLGKDAAGLTRWFRARMRAASKIRSPKYLGIELYGVGEVSILDTWPIQTKFSQARQADGLTGDDTDNTAKSTERAKKILTDTQYYGLASVGTPGFTTNGIADIDSKLLDYIKNYEVSISGALNEFGNAAAADWGIDYEPATPDIWMKQKGNWSSGFLLTNNIAELSTSPWNVDKLMFLLTRQRKDTDQTLDRGYGIYYCLGLYDAILDWNKTSNNATFALYNNYYACAFTPAKSNLVGLSLYGQRVGTPPDDMSIYVIGQDGSGNPNASNILRRVVIKKETLQALSTSAAYFDVFFDDQVQVVPNTKIFIVIGKNGNASNFYGVNYQTGAGEYRTSTDGSTFGGSTVGEARIRTYFATEIMMPFIHVNALKKYGTPPKQGVLAFPSMNYRSAIEMCQGYSKIKSKAKRIYEPLLVSTPYNPPKPGSTIALRDQFTGLDTVVQLASIDISANAYDISRDGTTQMTIHVAEVN